MAQYELSQGVNAEIKRGLNRHLALNKQDNDVAHLDEDYLLSEPIYRMELLHRDDRGMEKTVTDWVGKKVLYDTSLSNLARYVEVAAATDAAYQIGSEQIYVVAFHAENHKNRSRFFFKVPGGQELPQAVLAREASAPNISERLMPDILRHADAAVERAARKEHELWQILWKMNVQFSSVIQEYMEREDSLRKAIANVEEHSYEREKQRKADQKAEDREKWIMDVAPKVFPHVINTLQDVSGAAEAPKLGDIMMMVMRSMATSERLEAEAKEASRGRGDSGEDEYARGWAESPAPSSPGSRVRRAPEEPPVEASTPAIRDDAPLERQTPGLDQLKLRVAIDTCRFVGLARGRGKLDTMRVSLKENQQKLLDEIIEVSDSEDIESNAVVDRLASLSLAFGLSVREDAMTMGAVFLKLDKACQFALKELSVLLQVYADRLKAVEPGKS
jgi:hypothetical protein